MQREHQCRGIECKIVDPELLQRPGPVPLVVICERRLPGYGMRAQVEQVVEHLVHEADTAADSVKCSRAIWSRDRWSKGERAAEQCAGFSLHNRRVFVKVENASGRPGLRHLACYRALDRFGKQLDESETSRACRISIGGREHMITLNERGRDSAECGDCRHSASPGRLVDHVVVKQ